MNSKTWLRFFTIVLMALLAGSFLLPVVSAQGAIEDFSEPFEIAFTFIVDIFKLDFLENTAEAYGAIVRFCLWLITFAIVYEVLTKFQYFSSKTSKIIALCFATIAMVFMPLDSLLAIGGIWAAFMIMLFTGAIVYVGWRLAQWIKNTGGEGTPGSKWIFAVIMLVLIYIVYILQFALTEERGMDFTWWILPTIFTIYGWIMLMFLVYLLITGTFFSGALVGAAVATAMADSGPRGDTGSRERKKVVKKEEEVMREAEEIKDTAHVSEQLARVEERIDTMMLQTERNALGALSQLDPALQALEAVAKQIEGVEHAETQAEFQERLAVIIAKVHELVVKVAEEDKLAEQEVQNLKKQVAVIRKEEIKLEKKMFDPLTRTKGLMSRAHKKGAKDLEKAKGPSGDFRALWNGWQQGAKHYNEFMGRIEVLETEGRNLINRAKRLGRKEEQLVKRAKREINKEVRRLQKIEKKLKDLAKNPDAGEIANIREELREIAVKVQERVQNYQFKDAFTKRVQQIQLHIEKITAEVEEITKQCINLAAQEEKQADEFLKTKVQPGQPPGTQL